MLINETRFDKSSPGKISSPAKLRLSIKEAIRAFDFTRLFIDHLGWNSLKLPPTVVNVKNDEYTLHPFTEKCGVLVYICLPDAYGYIPEFLVRRQIEREATKIVYEHMIIYIDEVQQRQIWQWVRRELGGKTRSYEHHYYKGQDGESLAQKLNNLSISLEEEEFITRDVVINKMKKTFNVEHITKKFYANFLVEHRKFLTYIKGITVQEDLEWYTSLLLSRLMLVYFIQKKGFLDGDEDYLANHLERVRSQNGKNNFYAFYKQFLIRLFRFGLGNSERSIELEKEFGFVPYLNGGLFEEHILERNYPDIQIADDAFDGIFQFFSKWQWHLDEREEHNDDDINPDVLGYIFEKFTNQKEIGAYYTKEDITEYIARNTIIPCLFRLIQKYTSALPQKYSSLWSLLQDNPDRYFYETTKYGEKIPLTKELLNSLQMRSQDYRINDVAHSNFALLNETWREMLQRRKKHNDVWCKLVDGDISSVHDLVTYNLNIFMFMQDILEQSCDCELIKYIYMALSRIKILDPTCGSGAFLLAALNVLKPLYDICLTKMEEMVDRYKNSKYPDEEASHLEIIEYFQEIIDQAASHHSRDFFVTKFVIMNNIYGVDIKQEVVEICKLRLFLKLVALVDEVEDVEPLPDVDFNIITGNSLSGFATYNEVKEAILGGIQKKFDFGNFMDLTENALQKAALMYNLFRTMQNQAVVSSDTRKALKEQLQDQLMEVNKVLNQFLENYQPDLESNRSFHWFVGFYDVMVQGGFDVIIGNPPYIEYSKVKRKYRVQGYGADNYGNLYAAVVERSFALCCEQGYIGLIVPLSICGGERFGKLRDSIMRNTSALWLANFDIFPCRLFEGAYQRLSIMIANHSIKKLPSEHHQIYVTNNKRWYASERPYLLEQITYTPIQRIIRAGVFPKLAATLQESILLKVMKKSEGYDIGRFLSKKKTDYYIYYQEATNYWMKATCRIPFYQKNGVIMAPPHGRFLFFGDNNIAQNIMAIMNSSLFYLWFVTYSDGFHLSHALVKGFPVGKEASIAPALISLSQKLETEIQLHGQIGTRNTQPQQNKAGDMIEIEQFRVGRSKALLDQIDIILAQIYGFSDEELDFIINYDIKYRMRSD